MELRGVQEPLKAAYRADANRARITLRAEATGEDDLFSCSVDLGRTIQAAGAHAGVGGSGSAACSGDLLLGALAACAQITCQMVAAASGIPVESVRVTVEGDLDLRGTLAVSREAAVGFEAVRVAFDVVAPAASEKQLERLKRATEQYCVVMQTLLTPPPITVAWRMAPAGES